MQEVHFKEACVSFSSQTNYINTKNKLPGQCQALLALHCSVEPEALYEELFYLIYSLDLILLFSINCSRLLLAFS